MALKIGQKARQDRGLLKEPAKEVAPNVMEVPNSATIEIGNEIIVEDTLLSQLSGGPTKLVGIQKQPNGRYMLVSLEVIDGVSTVEFGKETDLAEVGYQFRIKSAGTVLKG